MSTPATPARSEVSKAEAARLDAEAAAARVKSAAAVKPSGETPKAAAKKGRPAGQPKVYDFGGLSPALLSAPQEVDSRMASQFAPSRARDENQIAMDGIVKKYHDEWINAGTPTKWAAMPKARYHIPPAAEEGFRFLVRRAADFHGVAIKWGGQQGTKVRDAQGNLVLVFAIRDRRERPVDATDSDETGDDLDNGESGDDEKTVTEFENSGK